MNDKCLPIGTVCKVKNNDSLIMIIGYNNTNNRLYDYKICNYPIGVENNNIYTANHSDILYIVSRGYVSKDYYDFCYMNFSSYTDNSFETLNDIKFDENGIIQNCDDLIDNTISFEFDENGVIKTK